MERDSAAKGRSTRLHDVSEVKTASSMSVLPGQPDRVTSRVRRSVAQGTFAALGEAVKAEAVERALPLSQEKEFPDYQRKNLTKAETGAEKAAADKQEALDKKLEAQKKKNALAKAAKIKEKAQEKKQD